MNKCYQNFKCQKRREGLKVRSTEKYLCQSCLLIVALVIHQPPLRGVRQPLLSPDLLTTGGVPKRRMVYRNVGSFPMKVGWVSRYDTSTTQCPFFLFWGRRQGRQPLRT